MNIEVDIPERDDVDLDILSDDEVLELAADHLDGAANNLFAIRFDVIALFVFGLILMTSGITQAIVFIGWVAVIYFSISVLSWLWAMGMTKLLARGMRKNIGKPHD